MTGLPPGDPPVLARVEGAVGRLTLNRPKALHALTTEMCRLMTDALLAWRADPAVALVMIDHAGERGFCAGGDIRMLAASGAGDGAEAREFFAVEYRLNALLHDYPKPTLAVMDGVTMGGGVGVSRPCRHRVATERTVFAMPETGIGLFPDVGGGWFLPRMPGAVGLWLALTGARLKAADCLLTAVATDYLESAQVDAFKAAVLADPTAAEALLAEHGGDPGPPPLAQVQDEVDRLFGADSLVAIADALGADDGEWARAQGHVLATKSPHSMAVAYRQLREGAAMPDFAAEMAAEHRIGGRMVHSHDFLEGVRALLVDKDNAPRWSPSTVEEVTPAMLDAVFAPAAPGEEWTPLA